MIKSKKALALMLGATMSLSMLAGCGESGGDATTAAAMEEVLPWLAQNGYQNVNISDMAKAHGKTLAGGQVHTRA